MIVLRDVSTDGKYIGLLVLLWFMPMSTILLIMLPKVVTHCQGADRLSRSARVRGSRAAGRVTGISQNGVAESANRTSFESVRASDGRHRTSSDANNLPLQRQSEEETGEFAED